MARSIWKGSIAFGLVNIPVELYSAVRDHRPKFRLLHAKDEARCGTTRVPDRRQARRVGGPRQGLRVREGTVRRDHQGRLQDRRGREDEDDRHPRLRRSGRRSTSATSKRRTTCRRAKGPSAPTRCCARRSATRGGSASPRSSCARRSTSPPSKAIGDALVLTMMRFADELADLGDFSSPKGRHPSRRAEDGRAADRQPRREVGSREVHRPVQENLMRVINAKMKGKRPQLTTRTTAPKQAEVVDLMARLRASLEGKTGGAARAVDPRRRPPASKSRKAPRGRKPGGVRCRNPMFPMPLSMTDGRRRLVPPQSRPSARRCSI